MSARRLHPSGLFSYASGFSGKEVGEYHDCRLLRDIPLSDDSGITFHQPDKCRKDAVLAIVCDNGSRLEGYTDTNERILDYVYSPKSSPIKL